MKSMKVVAMALALLPAACSSPGGQSGQDAGADQKSDAGAQPGGPTFDISVLDAAAPGRLYLAMAAKGAKIGVAYYVDVGNQSFELRYVEKGGTPQVVETVKKVYGVSLVFDASGNPVIGYLGGTPQVQYGWTQSDLTIATNSGGGWQKSNAATMSGDAVSGQTFNDTGDVVGLFPALAVRANGDIFAAYRDVHYGQFPTDWKKSDLEMVEGRPGAWASRAVIALGGPFEGAGGLNSTVIGVDDEPAVAWSSFPANAGAGSPVDVYFARRHAAAWNPKMIHTSGGTNSGPSLAYDARVGFAVAFQDEGQGVTYYQESADGDTWQAADPIFTAATGGWYPSLAFTPDGDPAIASYDCSVESGAAAPCPASDDALVLAIRSGGMWPTQPITVDPDGAYWPKLTYLNGKAVIAYRDPATTKIKLAVEK